MCRVPSFKPSQPQPRWFAVVPVLFLDFLVMALPGGILPIMLNDHYGPRSYVIVGYAQSLKGMLAFIAAPAIGALSDVVGRKHLFLTCVLGTATPYAALGLGCSLDTHLLLLGLSGMLAATFPLAFAYICDVVPEGAARISAIGSTIGFGLGMAFLIGPPLGSLLDHAYGPRAVFGACLWVTLANVVVALCGIVERPQQQPRLPLSALLRRASPLRSLKMVRANAAMRLLVLITAWYYFALWGLVANKGLYARRRFGLGSRETAAQLSTFGLASTLSQGAGLRVARRWLSDAQIARRCFGFAVLSQLIYGVATASWMLYPAMALLGMSVGGFASLSAICSQVVSPRVLGEAQGVLASMKALMEGVGPLAFATAMTVAEGSALPGSPWLVGAACMTVSLLLCLRLERAVQSANGLDEPEQAQEEQGSYASGEETEPLAFGTQLVREGD